MPKKKALDSTKPTPSPFLFIYIYPVFYKKISWYIIPRPPAPPNTTLYHAFASSKPFSVHSTGTEQWVFQGSSARILLNASLPVQFTFYDAHTITPAVAIYKTIFDSAASSSI